MKLAEALLLRASQKKKLSSLRSRMTSNVLIDAEEEPTEDPTMLLVEYSMVLDEKQALMLKINHTNLNSRLPDGRTMAAALNERDTLIQRHAILDALCMAAKKDHFRSTRNEVKYKSSIDVSSHQKQMDNLAEKIRKLNNTIQENNWKIELIEE